MLESVTKRRNKEKNRARQHLEALQQQQQQQQQLQQLLGTGNHDDLGTFSRTNLDAGSDKNKIISVAVPNPIGLRPLLSDPNKFAVSRSRVLCICIICMLTHADPNLCCNLQRILKLCYCISSGTSDRNVPVHFALKKIFPQELGPYVATKKF